MNSLKMKDDPVILNHLTSHIFQSNFFLWLLCSVIPNSLLFLIFLLFFNLKLECMALGEGLSLIASLVF